MNYNYRVEIKNVVRSSIGFKTHTITFKTPELVCYRRVKGIRWPNDKHLDKIEVILHKIPCTMKLSLVSSHPNRKNKPKNYFELQKIFIQDSVKLSVHRYPVLWEEGGKGHSNDKPVSGILPCTLPCQETSYCI